MKALILIATLLLTTNCRSNYRFFPIDQDSLGVVQLKVAKIVPDPALIALLSRFVNQCKKEKSINNFSFGFCLISSKIDSGYKIVLIPMLFPLNFDNVSIFGFFEVNGLKIVCFGAISTIFRKTENFDFIPFISKEMKKDTIHNFFDTNVFEFHSPEYFEYIKLQNENYQILIQPCGNN